MKDKYKQILSVLLPLSFIIAACWHLTYWSTFDVNPFEYMGINDIVMSFIYPFVFSIIAVIVPLQIQPILRFIFTGKAYKDYDEKQKLEDKKEENKDLEQENKEEDINKEKKKSWWSVEVDGDKFVLGVKIIMIVCIVSLAIFGSRDLKWELIPLLTMFLALIVFMDVDFMPDLIPTRFQLEIFLVIGFIMASVVTGSKQRSYKVRDNICYDYTLDASVTNQRLKILGKLGDYFILTTLDNKIKYVVPSGSKSAFEIQTYESTK